MKPKRRCIAALIVLAVAGWTLHSYAGGDDGDITDSAENARRNWELEAKRNTLKGLDGVCILTLADSIDPELAPHGITEKLIMNDVELRLRKAGIRVSGLPEINNIPGQPFLCPVISMIKQGDSNIYSYDIELQFRQNVTLARNPTIGMAGVSTWTRGGIGYAPVEKLRVVRDQICDLVDLFANDYLAANPPQSATQPAKP